MPCISTMDFYASTPDIKSAMCYMQITGLSSVLDMDIRIVYIKNTKNRYIIMQPLVHKRYMSYIYIY